MKSKVILVYKDIEDSIAEETVWTESLVNGNHRVDNIPFYAPNLAYNDIISVENDGGILYFDGLIKPSGHSTIQIIFFNKDKPKDVLKVLETLGCRWEGMKEEPYYAVDVPAVINYCDVKDVLEKECAEGVLDYKESCLAVNHT